MKRENIHDPDAVTCHSRYPVYLDNNFSGRPLVQEYTLSGFLLRSIFVAEQARPEANSSYVFFKDFQTPHNFSVIPHALQIISFA